MQIVQINEKDLIDTVMLLREHPLGDIDDETINTSLIVRTLANDWGFWRTVTGNLKLVDDKLAVYNDLSQEDRQVVHTHPGAARPHRCRAEEPALEGPCTGRGTGQMV